MSSRVDVLRRERQLAGKAGLYLALIVGVFFFAGPFLWTVVSSLKTWYELDRFPPTFLPQVPQWANYADVFEAAPLARWLANSLLVTVLSTLGAVLSASLVAYSFARFSYPGRALLFTATLATMMLPMEVTLIPQYMLFSWLRWIDTYRPLIIPPWFGGGAFLIFLMRQFIMSLPRDLDEAAMIDGAGPLRVFVTILMPLCVPALITMTIVSFVGFWNNFMGPLIFLNTYEKQMLSVGIHFFRQRPEMMFSGKPTTHLLLTATTIAIVPSAIVFILGQRYFVRGVVMSGFKGGGV